MNAPAQRAAMTVFTIEKFGTMAEVKATIEQVLPVYYEMWKLGSTKNIPFEPNMEILVNLVSSGYRRFITGRRDGQIVCFQNWMYLPDAQSSRRTTAMMTGIFKRTPDACDTVDFIKFGIQTMRGYGANSILLASYAAVPGLKEKMEKAGCKLVEYLMEA